MANQQQLLIGGNDAPIHNDALQIELNRTGSVLGESLALEDSLARILVHNLLNRDDNVLNFKHSIGYTHSHSANSEKFEKALSKMIIPMVESKVIDNGAVETPFVATAQHKVPFIGEVIKNDDANPGQKYICTGHKYVLSSATPTQIINVCVNCPWEVMTKCVYYYGQRYWNIVNIKELLGVILKAKITLFNNNIITKYKQQHREQFAFMNRRNVAARGGVTIFVDRVSMDLRFSSQSTSVMDITETKNQIGRLAWTVQANADAAQVMVNSIIAKRSPVGVIIQNYSHVSYEGDLQQIDDDLGIITRARFNFMSNITIDKNGNIAQAGHVEKYKLVRLQLNDLGNTTTPACLFPANARAGFSGAGNIPQGVLTINGTWQAGGNITVDQLRSMFSTFEVKVSQNQSITIN